MFASRVYTIAVVSTVKELKGRVRDVEADLTLIYRTMCLLRAATFSPEGLRHGPQCRLKQPKDQQATRDNSSERRMENCHGLMDYKATPCMD